MANRSRKPEQRAYTMRLQNLDPDDSSWRTRLWETHVAVNRGAKVFGDWLLTLKGGLPHTLVDEPVATGMGKRKTERDPTPEDRKNRRVLLALSWLSVESKEGAPTEYLVGDQKKGKSSKADLEETVAELTDILKSRGLSDDQVEIWIKDCEASLTAAKRKDGVWVNRSKAFDHLARQAGVTRNDAVNVILHHFFGPINEYFELSIQGVEDEEKYRAKPDKLNYVQKAVNWISENWGTGLKSDKGSIGGNLKCILSLDFNCFIGRPKTEILSHIGKALGRHNVQSVSDIAALIGWKTGRHSAGRIALDNLPDEPAEQDLERLRDRMQGEADTKTAKGATRAKTPPAWINQLKDDVCNQSAIPFVCGRNLTFEFSVMLDHAARRVSAHHTWVKTAEAERIAFEQDNSKIRNVPDKARAWLDQYCEQRSIETGAVVPYRIRRRAIQGWPAVCEAWSSSQCRTEPDRIAEVRSLQEDPEVKGKTGDVQLFEALAAPDAVCAWKEEGKVCTDILSDYVAAKEAEFKRQHFKVPMYRHPDALHHPVFCDFGKSRWSIKFDTHEAHKDLTAKKRKANKGPETLRGLTMNLWDGKAISPTRLRWQGKRFSRDLKSAQWPPAPHNARPVSREDRLARAAGGLRRDECAGVLGIFQEKDWNGRLQAPRDQLAKLAHYVGLHGWNAKAVAMRDTLRWILSFSARLVPQGPWYGFRKDSETLLKELGWPYNKTNEKRGTQAKLLLCRIPGLRVLSVDLGHRFAAACAVWQTVTAEELSDACLQAGLLVDDLDQAMHLRLTLPERKGGAIYRRIGPPKLPDGRPHPAPWARLDRQFLIKLQGEDQEARRATDEESERVSTWMLELGLDESERLPRNVDELMTRAMDILRLGLQRHRRRAKIAFNLTAKKKLLPGGGSAEPRGKERVDHLTDALLEWHELQDGRRWTDEWAKALWDKQIVPLIAQQKLASFREYEDLRAQERRKRRETLKKQLESAAERLLGTGSNDRLHSVWAGRWEQDNRAWRERLRSARKWVVRRGSKATDKSIRRVGGLSLRRIATIRGLYQIQKAYAMQPKPDDLRANIPVKGDESMQEFGRKTLTAMERMRENRVKQIVSRVVEAALGIGAEKDGKSGKSLPRPKEPINAPCHVIVIENLRDYRPDEIRLRRENRQLMTWSAGKIRERLEEACNLYGLSLRQVSAAYTSRQDSRTGKPGMRCEDISISDFVKGSGYLGKRIARACQAAKEGNGKAEDYLLAELYARWNEKEGTWTDLVGVKWLLGRDARWSKENAPCAKALSHVSPHPVRIPQRGGSIFVSAHQDSPAARGIQADLNAAANIGLRALMDPDWPGRWWYVPCHPSSFLPVTEKIKGCSAIDQLTPLRTDSKSRNDRQIVNLWRDPSTRPAQGGDRTDEWKPTGEYWEDVMKHVIENLRRQAGLT